MFLDFDGTIADTLEVGYSIYNRIAPGFNCKQVDLSKVLLFIRRCSIVLVLFLGYLYYRFIGESYTLVTIGLISFLPNFILSQPLS